jgi:hypothetical protein
MKVIYIIGIPGTGKSTLMRALMGRISKGMKSEWAEERVADLLDTHVEGTRRYRILGKYAEGEIYSGTDRLSMAVSPKAVSWIKTKPAEIIIGEGDRLNNKAFFQACGNDLTIIQLTAPKSILEERYKERGSTQSLKFIQTTITKCKNVIEAYGDRQTLFGREAGCVVSFNHETPADTEKIINFILKTNLT